MKVLVLLLGTLCLAACSAFVPKLESPQLSVVNVELLKSTIWEQRLRVHMRVQNPNDRALPVAGLVYSIEVAGQELAHGAANDSFIVPALGESEFATDVAANVAGALITLLSRGHDAAANAVDYRIVGKVTLSQGMLRSIPFEHKGTFNLE